MEKAEKFKVEINSGKLEFSVEPVYSGSEVHYKISNRGGYLFTLIPMEEPDGEFRVSDKDLESNSNINKVLVHQISDAIENQFM